MGMFPENPDIEAVREYFVNDKFASNNGCRIIEGSRGHAICEFDITENHLNATGNVMGGAIFTLADYALAIASNVGEEPTVSVSNTIEFLAAAKGTTLIAEATCDKSGRSLGFYTVDVTDNTGRHVARMVATCKR